MGYGKLGKTAVTAPLYISLAWGLIISYQFFTETAVFSILNFINGFWSSGSNFLVSNIDVIVFIHAFAWIFVVSSVIPSVILGKSRSVLLQFVLCLTITLVAISLENVLTLIMGTRPATQLQALTVWFQSPFIAALYLSAPYLFMLYLDLHTRKKIKEQEKLQTIETAHFEESPQTEQKPSDIATIQTTNKKNPVYQNKNKGRMYFLFGASAICFLLAIFTFWFGNLISNTIFSILHKLIYVAMLIAIGAILLGLGCISTDTQEPASACLEEDIFSNSHNESVEPPKIPETSIPRFNEALVKEVIEQKENLIDIQIQEPLKIQPEIKNYDVRHPKDVVDSQC